MTIVSYNSFRRKAIRIEFVTWNNNIQCDIKNVLYSLFRRDRVILVVFNGRSKTWGFEPRLWHSAFDHELMTKALWQLRWQYDNDYDTMTMTLWQWHYDNDTMTMTLWQWHYDNDTMTMTPWLWHRDYDTMTMTPWLCHCDRTTVWPFDYGMTI